MKDNLIFTQVFINIIIQIQFNMILKDKKTLVSIFQIKISNNFFKKLRKINNKIFFFQLKINNFRICNRIKKCQITQIYCKNKRLSKQIFIFQVKIIIFLDFFGIYYFERNI